MNLFELYAKIALDPSEYESGVKKATKSGKSLKETLVDVGKGAAKGFAIISGAVTAVSGALLAVEGSTEEYRIAQGKLNTAFEAAGHSVEVAKGVYQDFFRILGDTDTATEASQLLAKLALNQEDLSKWTDIAAGVYGTFGDSLPIEGLIESANETARVGQVTGSLADALNWSSIQEDAFNEALKACTSEAERNQLIMDTLSGVYDEASDSFYKNNEVLIANRDAQARVTDAMAKIGEAVSIVKGEVLERFSPVIEDASAKIADFISKVDVGEVLDKVTTTVTNLYNAFNVLLPLVTGATAAFVAYKTATTISSIIDALRKATEGQTLAQAALNVVMNANPFVLVATLIAGLITVIITLWNTNEDFRNACINIWNAIKAAFLSAVQYIGDLVSGLGETIMGFINIGADIVNNIADGIASAWNGLVEWFNGLWNNLFGNRSVSVGVNASANVSGSHAGGLDYVPFDGYIAELHKGETVLTRSEAEAYRRGNHVGNGVTIIQNIQAVAKTPVELAAATQSYFEQARWAF